MNEAIAVVLLLVAGYVVGSFPSSVVYGRVFRGVDVRSTGSGKTGATNVLRTLGWKFAVAVGITDILKGLLPVLVARLLLGTPLAEVAAGLGAVAGHNWSLFLGFEGGRGVATSVGAFVLLAPLATVIAIAAFLATIALTRYVSLGSIVAAITALAALVLFGLLGAGYPGEYYVFTFAAATLLIVRHGDNISRLRAGTERKFGERVQQARPAAR